MLRLDHRRPGHLSEEVCEKLRTLYPHVQFRLHANARVLPRHVIWDASSVSEETLPYFETLFLRQKYFGASWMSIHAGYRNQCSEEELWNNVDILRNLAEKHDTSVCIEGLYPSLKTPQWIDSWEGYEEFLVRSVPFALDLSHLNIVARKQGWRHTLVEDLVSSPLCKEIHVSGNDGHRDNHQKLTEAPSWDVHLKKAHADTVVFSEGRIL